MKTFRILTLGSGRKLLTPRSLYHLHTRTSRGWGGPCVTVVNQSYLKAKKNQSITEAQLYGGKAVDTDFYLDMISVISQLEMAEGYRLRMERHEISFND